MSGISASMSTCLCTLICEDDNASRHLPLRQPGAWHCMLHLIPHFTMNAAAPFTGHYRAPLLVLRAFQSSFQSVETFGNQF